MLEIAGSYMARGMYREAEDVLRQSIKFADGPKLRAMLADASFEQGDVETALSNYLSVVQVTDRSLSKRMHTRARTHAGNNAGIPRCKLPQG